MLFRVTLSSGVDEHYKEIPMDTQMSLIVEASSFNNAMLKAQAQMITLVFWPTMFEVVSVDRIDPEYMEEIHDGLQSTAYENGCRCEDCLYDCSEPVKKAPELWILQTGIQILDPDGWDRKNYQVSWYEPITRDEFIERAKMSTCYAWPKPLYDEEEETTDIDRKNP